MSDSTGKVTDITREEMEEKTMTFLQKNGGKLLAGGALLLALVANSKVNKLEARTGKALNSVAKELNKTNDMMTTNFDAIYQNFRIARADLSNIATFCGFQGKLGCNNISEE